MSEQQRRPPRPLPQSDPGDWPRRDRSHRDGASRRRAARPAVRSAGEVLEPRDERHPDRGAAEVLSRARAQARIGGAAARRRRRSDDRQTRPLRALGVPESPEQYQIELRHVLWSSRIRRSMPSCTRRASPSAKRSWSTTSRRTTCCPCSTDALGEFASAARGRTARGPLSAARRPGARRRSRSRPGDRRTSPRRSSRRWRRATTACSPSIR